MLWQLGDETALDLLARHVPRSFRTGLRFLDAPVTAPPDPTGRFSAGGGARGDGFRPRQVVELCGPADSPKTELLLHVVAAFLRHDAQARVYMFDHEHEVRAERLVAILEGRGESGKEARETAARVTLTRCRDTFQLLATLNSVHFKLLDEPPTPLLIVFNCIGSFRPIDKMTARRVGEGLTMADQTFVFLKHFIRFHSPFVFAAKTIKPERRRPWEHNEYMPSTWSKQVTKRIFIRSTARQHNESTSNLPDEDARMQSTNDAIEFEAKCVVNGESDPYSQEYSAHLHGMTITCAPLETSWVPPAGSRRNSSSFRSYK